MLQGQVFVRLPPCDFTSPTNYPQFKWEQNLSGQEEVTDQALINRLPNNVFPPSFSETIVRVSVIFVVFVVAVFSFNCSSSPPSGCYTFLFRKNDTKLLY